MTRRIPASLILGAVAAVCLLPALGQDDEPDVRIAGPISTRTLLTGVVHAMKEEKGLRIAITTDYTSLDAIDALAQEKAGIALITKPLKLEDQAQYPQFSFYTTPIGMQVVALGVSTDLWDAGLHAINCETMRAIYEQKIKNWREAGGPDEKITQFNFEQGLGIWEILAEWLYGDNRKAPIPRVEKVASNEDARDAVEFTPGSIAPVAALAADGVRCHALGIKLADRIVWPTPQDVAARRYPIVRPIIAVTIGRPGLAIRTVTEFLTGPEGQALVKKSGALGTDAVPKPSPNPYY